MRLYWIQDRVNDKELYVYRKAGAENFADYFTKYFSLQYNQTIRPTCILKTDHMNTTDLQREGVLIYQDITPWGYQDTLGAGIKSHKAKIIFYPKIVTEDHCWKIMATGTEYFKKSKSMMRTMRTMAML